MTNGYFFEQFLRLTAKFLTVLRLTVNPIETLEPGRPIYSGCQLHPALRQLSPG